MATGEALPFTFRNLARRRSPEESCELCGAAVSKNHAHLVEIEQRRIMCACAACAILFNENTRRFRRIPSQVWTIPQGRITDAHWSALGIPINLAFLFRSSPNGQLIAQYPSPGGGIESVPPQDVWPQMLADEPRLEHLENDVQALLVNRLTEPYEYLIAPIDRCFELIGLVRLHWQGFTGGTKLQKEVRTFFDRLRAEAKVIEERRNA